MGGEGIDLMSSYHNIGTIKNDRGEYEKAIEYYSKALELKGDHAHCYYTRGLAYKNMERYEKAI